MQYKTPLISFTTLWQNKTMAKISTTIKKNDNTPQNSSSFFPNICQKIINSQQLCTRGEGLVTDRIDRKPITLSYCISHLTVLNTVNQAQPLQTSLQFGLWALADDLECHLSFATRTVVRCCKAPPVHLLWQDVQWLGCYLQCFDTVGWAVGRASGP